MKLELKDNEYFEIYFNGDNAQIVFGHLYFDPYHGYSQIYKDSFITSSIKVVLNRLDPRCGQYVKEIKDYMNDKHHYFAIYRLNKDDKTYYIKEEETNKTVLAKGSLLELVEENILNENQTQEV